MRREPVSGAFGRLLVQRELMSLQFPLTWMDRNESGVSEHADRQHLTQYEALHAEDLARLGGQHRAPSTAHRPQSQNSRFYGRCETQRPAGAWREHLDAGSPLRVLVLKRPGAMAYESGL